VADAALITGKTEKTLLN